MRRVAILVGLAVSLPACNALLGIDDVAPVHDAPLVDAPAGSIDAPLLVIDAATDAPPGTPDAKVDAAPMIDAGVPDAGALSLTVKDYLSWCSVAVGANPASSNATQTITVTAGDVVQLSAMANASFELGDWHHTDGDTGGGDPGTKTGNRSNATVTIGGTSACVWVCCPFQNPPGSGCPTTDQCP